MNKYAAQAALECVKQHYDGDAIGKGYILEGLERLASGQEVTVQADSSEAAAEDLRWHLCAVYCLLVRPDPTEAEYRGAVLQSVEYMERNFPHVLKLYAGRK